MDRAKRLQEESMVAEDFMLKARIIMKDDPFKKGVQSDENRAFFALIGKNGYHIVCCHKEGKSLTCFALSYI